MTVASSERRTSGGDGARAAARGLPLAAAPALTGVVIGVLYTLGATSYKVGTLSSPGPGLFPLIVGIVIMMTSAVYLVTECLRPSAPPEGRGHAFRRVPTIGLGILAYIVLLKPAGFCIAATVLCGVLLWILGRRPWWLVFAIALAASAACYYLFNLLGVPLPAGLLAL